MLCIGGLPSAFGQEGEAGQTTQQTPEPAPAAGGPAEDAPSVDEKDEEPATADDSERGEQERPGGIRNWASGRFDASFDGIWSDSHESLDLDQTLQLNIDPPEHDRIHLRSLFWLRQDLGSDDVSSPLRDLDDSFDSDFHADIVYLHLDVDDLWGESTLRIGRQRIVDGVAYNRIDGVYFRKEMPRWQWYAFAGWQASLYDHAFDDPAFGGGASFQLTSSTRLAVDAYWVEEDRIHFNEYYRRRLSDWLYRDYPRGLDHSLHDSSIAVTLWQSLTDNIRFMGRFEWLDTDGQRLTLQTTGYIPALDLTFEVRYRRLFDELEDRASDLTSYYRILGPQQEYQELRIVLHRPLTERLALSLEGEFRDTDNHYPGPDSSYWDRAYDFADKSNQDFKHYTATLSADKLPWGLEAMLFTEYWDIEDFDDTWQIGGEVTKKWDEFSLTLGAEYSSYDDYYTRYNFWPGWQNQLRRALFSTNTSSLSTFYYNNNFTVNLRDVVPVNAGEDIYSIFAEARWAFTKNQELRANVTFEEDDSDESPYWRVRAGYTLKF